MQTGTSDRPRFRQDLVAEPIEDGNTRFIDVMDPDSGNVFRFYEVEYSLACAMDGERDVPGIVQWAREELGLTPSPNEVRTVIATLGDLGFIEGGAQVAAQPRSDLDVRPGVVVGQRRPATPVADVELGSAGSNMAAATDRDMPVADVELAPGVTAARQFPSNEATSVDEIPLGVPGRGDVSLDLDMKPSVADVKEAVRASQVMKAVDVPPELAAALEKPQPRPAAQAQQRPVEAPKPIEAPKPVEQPRVEARPQPQPQQRPVEARPQPQPQPQQRPEAKPPVAPPAPASGTSRTLILLLVVVAIAAAAFAVWKFVLDKSDEGTQSSTPPPKPQVAQPKPPEAPPAPPPVESVKLGTSAEATDSIKPVAPGTIESIAETNVKAGDVIVRFTGHKPIETEVANLERDIEKRVKPELENAKKERDAAQAAGNKAGVTAAEARIADRQKSLDDKEGKLAAKKTDLDKFVLKALADGKVTAKAKAGAKVTPNDEIATLVHAPTRVATFKKADAGPKTRVVLVSKADGKKLSCTVTKADATGTTIECPADAAPEGTEVTFGGVDTTPPPDEPAAGSAAAPAAGSAAVPAPAPAPARPVRAAPARPTPARPARPATPPATGSADKAPTATGSADKAPDKTEAPATPPAGSAAGSN